jgi:hypothetical protein
MYSLMTGSENTGDFHDWLEMCSNTWSRDQV